MEPTPSTPNQRLFTGTVLVSLLAIVAVTVLCYSSILFNSFCSDDFVHLTWLQQALQNPELIWRNFHSSWLDGTTTRFYRPLISIFMVSDYLLWGPNGFGFHLTNLIFHLVSSFLVYANMICLTKPLCLRPDHNNNRQSFPIWPLAAAALFAFYPLHPEAVSWITGRVDTIATTFILACLWTFGISRRPVRYPWLWGCLSGLCMVFGLLSKEMAITLPAVLFSYNLFLNFQSLPSAVSEKPTAWKTISGYLAQSILVTLPFWIILIIYFVIRRLALGTFVGGYDDSLFFIANWKNFCLTWLHAVRMLLVPLNKELIGAHHPLTKIWELTIGLSLLAVPFTLVRRPGLRPIILFLLAWLALSLVPVYKIFAINDDLEGSRLAYLATAPLVCLITIPCAMAAASIAAGWKRFLWISPPAILIVSSVAGLMINNSAWCMAGHESNAIRLGLQKIYAYTNNDPQTLLIGLPDQNKGAYICRNALSGMTHQPQFFRNVNNCIMLNNFEPILPFGYLKNSIAQNAAAIHIYHWVTAQPGFENIDLASTLATAGTANNSITRSQNVVVVPQPTAGCTFSKHSAGFVDVVSSLSHRPKLTINLSQQNCWNIDFITLSMQALSKPPFSSGADIVYTNDVVPDYDIGHRSHCAIEPTNSKQTLVFPLTNLPDWALGGKIHRLTLLLPAHSHILIKDIRVVSPLTLMPSLSFANSGYLGSKGFLHLSKTSTSERVSFTAANVPGACAVAIEITRPNLLFETQNTNVPSLQVMTYLTKPGTTGTVMVQRNMFKSTGIYEMRPRALDQHGHYLGVAGNHIVISVDS